MDEPTPHPVEQRFTIGEVSNQLGVAAHQLRRWCKYHAAHLSPEANPAHPGIERRLTAHDASVLSSVRDMRAQGLTAALINVRLGESVVGEVVEASHAAQEGPQQAQATLAVVDALKSIQTHLETIAPLSARIEALEQAQQATAAQRPTWRDVILFVMSAFIAGLILGLAVWWFQ